MDVKENVISVHSFDIWSDCATLSLCTVAQARHLTYLGVVATKIETVGTPSFSPGGRLPPASSFDCSQSHTKRSYIESARYGQHLMQVYMQYSAVSFEQKNEAAITL